MIQINDNDTPLEVAKKLIEATIPVESELERRVLGDEKIAFSLSELTEIAGYLIVFVNCNKVIE